MLAEGVSRLIAQLRDGAKGLVPLIILAVYTLIGALLFRELEGPNEQYTLETLKKERAELLENTVYRLNNIRGMTPMAAYNHTVKTLTRYGDKLGVEAVNPEETRWNIWGSVFYCMTVYTTIGYGNIVPITTAGRVLTILYAFIGIPLAVICLFSLGQLFAKVCTILWKMLAKSTRVVSKDLEKKMSLQVDTMDSSDSDDLLNFPISFLVALTIIWIFACAGIFMLWEDWDYGTSLYFTLISFTTIGFGDVLPSEYDYMIVVGFLLLIGLSLVSTVMTLIQQQIEALATGMQGNIDKEYMNALEEAANEDGHIQEITRRASTTNTDKVQDLGDVDIEQVKAEMDPRSLDAVISRMPLKSRLLYHIMPAGSKKQLQQHSEARLKQRSTACQTDDSLLQDLVDALTTERLRQMGLSTMSTSGLPSEPYRSENRPHSISESDASIDFAPKGTLVRFGKGGAIEHVSLDIPRESEEDKDML